MHRPEVLFQLSLYILLCISSHILGVAEGSAVPYVLTLPLLALSFFFTERWQLLVIPMWLASGFSLLALFSAGAELVSGTLEQRFLGGAHLLVYLTWIVAFLVKEVRQYWWMLALSLMQVAVGAVLTKDESYGGWVLVYTVGALWTLSLMRMYQVHLQYAGTGPASDATRIPAPASHSPAGNTRSPAISEGGSQLLAPGLVQNVLHGDSRQHWPVVRFAIGSGVTTLAALMLAAAFFFLIPRVSAVWKSRRMPLPSSGELQTPSLTGFTQEVRLGDIGEILESTDRVLEVRLWNTATEQPISAEEFSIRHNQSEPLFRGTVLNLYRNGHWQTSERQAIPVRLPEVGKPGAVRQDITLQPIGTDILFAMHPVSGCRLEIESSSVIINAINGVMMRQSNGRNSGAVSYSVFSPPNPSMHRPLRATTVPPEGTREYRRYRRRLRRLMQTYGRLPERGLEPLIREARQVAGRGNVPPRERAERLLTYLRDSDRFSYSLSASIVDETVDPVVDFLQNRQAGHCEYFASALALMLRATGIPSRLVSGFKGGSHNQFTGAYEVQQRHAHAWVEAWIDEDWTILDPTPAAERTRVVASLAPRLRSLGDFRSLLKEFWTNSIVKLDMTQQQAHFYQPLKLVATAWWQSMKGDHSAARSLLSRARQFLKSPGNWFSMTGGLVSFTLLLALAAIGLGIRGVYRLVRRLRESRQTATRMATADVAFYERFRRVCERQGLTREPWQTQREFADEVHRHLTNVLQAAGLGEFPRRLVEEFYRIRFGRMTPSPATVTELEQHLSRLEESLSRPEAVASAR